MLRIDSVLLRSLLLTLAVVGILFFLLPFSVHIINVGNTVGLAVSVLLLCFVIWNHPISDFLGSLWQKRAGKIILCVIYALIIVCMLLALVLSVMMICAANKKTQNKPQAVIILGCKVRGTEPSLMLSRRIQAAYDVLVQNPELIAVVSGGQGDNEDISEAECMERELIRRGIDASRIIREDRSVSTSENLRFSRKLLEEHQISGPVWIATDGFHELRAQFLAKKEGLSDTAAVSAYTSWYLLPTYWVREWFGLMHVFVFGS